MLRCLPQPNFVKKTLNMNTIIDRLRPVFLYVVLLNAGLYAGLHFAGILDPSIFGIINFNGNLMPSVEWAKRWQIVDGFMGVRMAVFGPIILWSYVITILLFVKRWKSLVFWLLVAAFGLFIADVALTLNFQVPINQYIQKIDFNNVTAEQAKTLGKMHLQVIKNFGGREWLSILGFALVAACSFLWKSDK
jgi:hypothetical protein